MVCFDISNQKAAIYLKGNKLVIETPNNNPLNTIDLSAEYVRANNLVLKGDISNDQLHFLDASMIQIFDLFNNLYLNTNL